MLVRGLEHGVIDQALFDMAISRPVPDAAPRHADERAASRGLAGRPVARHDRADDIRFELQSALGQLVADERGQMADKAQIAMVVIDNRTGGVVAWLGGGDFFGRAGQVDLVRAHRSPGSALKPMIYALAFDDRTLHPESLVEDVPVRFKRLAAAQLRPRPPGRRHRAPRAAAVAERAGRAGAGEGRPAALPRRPCARPASRPACRRAIPATRSAWRSAAPRSRRWKWPASIPASPTAASFAPPQVRRDQPRPEPVRLVGPTAAWYVADILADAPLPEGFASLPVALRDRRIAYKTGTSAGFRDAWAAGYSANWTVVVWVGHADGTPRPGQLGRLAALPIAVQGVRPPARRGQSRAAGRRPT